MHYKEFVWSNQVTKEIHFIVIKRKKLFLTGICFLSCMGVIFLFLKFYSAKSQPAMSQGDLKYVILATCTLGMHCYQSDYSSYFILPPGNTLRAQIFLNSNDKATLVNSGIDVSYQIIDNTTSADKTNFWDYSMDYGYDIEPNIGITGNGLSGEMELSEDGNYYEATAIPVTAYNDGSSELNPYQLAIITVTDKSTGQELAKVDSVVVPASDEMLCSTCHGIEKTGRNILEAHDKYSNTNLVEDLDYGIRHKCSDCHADIAMGEQGREDVPSLSQAMHGFHADKMGLTNITPKCYSCHPGPVTQCYRGAMARNGISCVNARCHGDMNTIATSIEQGREPWLQEPNCGNCHGSRFNVNENLLYSSSYLVNNANDDMNGFILCLSCHNGAHAEWISLNPKDNLLPTQLLGYPDYINKCSVCHEGSGRIHDIQ